MACSLEQKSEHPLAKAIVKKAEEQQISWSEAENFHALPGNGLSAIYQEKEAWAGNTLFISRKIKIPELMKQKADQLAEEGKTPLWFAQKDRLLGMIAVAVVI